MVLTRERGRKTSANTHTHRERRRERERERVCVCVGFQDDEPQEAGKRLHPRRVPFFSCKGICYTTPGRRRAGTPPVYFGEQGEVPNNMNKRGRETGQAQRTPMRTVDDQVMQWGPWAEGEMMRSAGSSGVCTQLTVHAHGTLTKHRNWDFHFTCTGTGVLDGCARTDSELSGFGRTRETRQQRQPTELSAD